jgi:rRNA-processing protein FCF1
MQALQHIQALIEDAVEKQVAFLATCGVHYNDINRGSGMVILGWNSWRWDPLTPESQRPLGLARAATDKLTTATEHAVLASEPERIERLRDALGPFRSVLDQNDGYNGAPGDSIAQITEKVQTAGQEVRDLIENLPSAHGDGGRWLVPDTNALVWNSDLTRWRTDEPTTLVIVPTVTQELDELKMREGNVGKKATKMIRQLHEFDRRGNTLEGVTVAGDLHLREVAMYPNFDIAPKWLVSENADDQIIASALELGWSDLRSDVSVVTRDRNMKNRARLAGLTTIDADELAGQEIAASDVVTP